MPVPRCATCVATATTSCGSSRRTRPISEDDLRRGLDEVQKLTDEHIEVIGDVLAAKEKEILEV